MIEDEISALLRLMVREEVERALAARNEFAPLLSLMEVAEHLNVSESTVRNLLRSGALEGRQVAGRKLVRRVDLDRFIDASRVDVDEAC